MANTHQEHLLPNLPNDIILSIFIKSDSKTFARCRSLASSWNSLLCNEDTVSQHLSTFFGPCALLQLNDPMMLYRLGHIVVWRFNRKDHACLRFPYPWEWFAVIGAIKGYIIARYSMDPRTSKIIIWNPITNNVRRISDPGSSNYSNNRAVSGLAIYSVVPIQDSSWFVGTIPQESQISNCPQLISLNSELFYVAIDRNSTNNHLHMRSVSIANNNTIQWGNVFRIPCYDLWTAPRISVHNQIFGFSRTTSDVIVRISSSMPALRILSHIKLKMINKDTGEILETGRLEFNKNVTISQMFHFHPSLE
ncbi:hypothetical protein PIB30_029808 [Stylosanthes scabra]|uniref:F-box domain-containing protein n=1 Tax=Stylosanthes scabra TaxID=79078 RepID=A0ABU6UCF1_9FABA|nr:hypothetical protein [Stylosanthes scabra]